MDSLVFRDVNQTELKNIIISLKNSSPGKDNIHPRVLKYTYESYLIPSVHICNLSISQGILPNKMEKAKVIPLFKSGNKMLLNNYRPVSVLPLF